MTTDHSLWKEEGNMHTKYSDTYDTFYIEYFLQILTDIIFTNTIYLPISPSFPLLTGALFSFGTH